MRKLLIAFLLFALPFSFAFAQDESAENPQSVPAFNLKLSGLHQFDYRMPVYGEDFNYDGEYKEPRFRNELGVDVTEGEIKIVSHWQLDSTVDSAETGGDQWASATRARNLENYVSWNPAFFKMSFGYQIYAWGVADGRNPTDNLNPHDYTTLEGEKPLKIPVLSASVNWYPTEEVSLESVFVPKPQTSMFPVDNKEKLIGYGFSNVANDAIGNDPDHFIAGLKLNRRTQAADVSVSYVYDYDALLTPDISVNALGGVSGINLERRRVHRFGADFKTTIDKYGLWAEGCYSMTGNHDKNNYSERLSKIDYTIGFDFSYGPQDDYYVNFQYTGTVVPGYDKSENTVDPTDMQRYYERLLVGQLGSETEGITQGITWNAKWNLKGGQIVPKFTGSYSMPFNYDDSKTKRYGNLMLKPEIDVMPFDSFHIVTGCILTYAFVKENGGSVKLDTTQDSVGIYTSGNNAFISIYYQWNYETTK